MFNILFLSHYTAVLMHNQGIGTKNTWLGLDNCHGLVKYLFWQRDHI